MATFTSETNCSGTAFSWCSVQIYCDNVELQPAVDGDFIFDSVGPTSTTARWQSHSVTRRSNSVTGGHHTCEVRTLQTSGATTLRLDDWTFVVQFWKQ